jgi:hypothetical protein
MTEDEMTYTEGGAMVNFSKTYFFTDAEVNKIVSALKGGGGMSGALSTIIGTVKYLGKVAKPLAIIGAVAYVAGEALKAWNKIDGISGGTRLTVTYTVSV